MTDYFDNYFFTSNASSYECPTFGSLQCQPPNACARDPHTGKEYCCDYGDVCWSITSPCANDGSTLSCGNGDNTWCCLDATEVCTATKGQINVCWNSAHDTLTNISSKVLNETYSSLSHAAPSASTWSFNPGTLIAATQTHSTSHTSSTTSSGPTKKPTSPSPSSSTSLSGGAIAGIVIGVIAGVALLAVGIYLLRRLNKRRRNDFNAPVQGPAGYEADPKGPKQLGNQEYYHPELPPQELQPQEMQTQELERHELPANSPTGARYS